MVECGNLESAERYAAAVVEVKEDAQQASNNKDEGVSELLVSSKIACSERENAVAAATAAAQAAVAAVLANSPRLRPLMESDMAKSCMEELEGKTNAPYGGVEGTTAIFGGGHVSRTNSNVEFYRLDTLEESLEELSSPERHSPNRVQLSDEPGMGERSPSIGDLLDAVETPEEPPRPPQPKSPQVLQQQQQKAWQSTMEYLASMARHGDVSSGTPRKDRNRGASPKASRASSKASDGPSGSDRDVVEKKGMSARHSLGKPQQQANKLWANSLRGDEEPQCLTPRSHGTRRLECQSPNQIGHLNGSPMNGHRSSPFPSPGRSPACQGVRHGSTPTRNTQGHRHSPQNIHHQQDAVSGDGGVAWQEEKRRLHEVVDALTSAVKALQARCEVAEAEADSLRKQLGKCQQQLTNSLVAKQR